MKTKISAPKGFVPVVLLSVVVMFAGSAAVNAQVVDLFNGKDFTGWTFFMRSNSAPEKTWNIANGIIRCAGKPAGYLRTEKSYQDYKLTVEWRFVKVEPHADNTGILIHMQLPDKIWPKCIECQGQSRKQGDFWLQGGATAASYPNTGKNNIHVSMTEPANEKPVGEWNRYQIVAHGMTVETIVNGRSMNKITDCSVASGFIGIQSEGAEIEVRKMQLEPLSSSFNGKK